MKGSIAPVSYRPRLVDRLLDDLLPSLPGLLLVGPRAAGKTTTVARRARTVVRLDAEAESAAFRADPNAALSGLDEPVLLDEWQEVPGVFGAARRAIDANPSPARFLLTGSARAELENQVWPGTGRLARLTMYPMTVREQRGDPSAPTFFDKLAEGASLTVPADPPDIRGYLEIALASGLPLPALQLHGRARATALESYLEQLLSHDVTDLEHSPTRKRDTRRVRLYFEAYALNSANVCEHKTIYDAAGVNRITAVAYEQLLTDLFVVDQLPAWTSNRLERLTRRPKRYVVDAALVATALRLDTNGILFDRDLLGRTLDTFVAAQLRPELAVSSSRPRLYHLRTEQGRHEVDLVAELGGERLIGIEVKATASPGRADAKHLIWLRDRLGRRFVAGVVLHTGPRAYQLDERIVAAPIASLWG